MISYCSICLEAMKSNFYVYSEVMRITFLYTQVTLGLIQFKVCVLHLESLAVFCFRIRQVLKFGSIAITKCLFCRM